MLEQGHVRVYRKLLKWEWYGDIPTARVFVHLLLTVNYTAQRWRGRTIERGQRVTSLKGLAGETGLSVQSVRTALNHLGSTGEIACESTNRYTIITVKQYNTYQAAAPGTTGRQQADGTPPTQSQQQWKEREKAEECKKAEEEAVRLWNEVCVSLPAAQVGKAEIHRAIRALGAGEEELRQGFGQVEQSDFLCGRLGGWKASLAWVLKPENWAKIRSGTYENRRPPKKEGALPGKASYDLGEFEAAALYEPLVYEGGARDGGQRV